MKIIFFIYLIFALCNIFPLSKDILGTIYQTDLNSSGIVYLNEIYVLG